MKRLARGGFAALVFLVLGAAESVLSDRQMTDDWFFARRTDGSGRMTGCVAATTAAMPAGRTEARMMVSTWPRNIFPAIEPGDGPVRTLLLFDIEGAPVTPNNLTGQLALRFGSGDQVILLLYKTMRHRGGRQDLVAHLSDRLMSALRTMPAVTVDLTDGVTDRSITFSLAGADQAIDRFGACFRELRAAG